MIPCETWQVFSLEIPSTLAFRPSTGIRSSTSFYSTLNIYLVIGIYNKVCIILMLVSKRKREGQSKGKGVSVRDTYVASNDNETEQASSLFIGRAGIGRGIRMLGSKEKSSYRGHFT